MVSSVSSTEQMKPFHTRLWMKWEHGDTISPRARSLSAERLIFPSGAEMIFCPSFFTANQCRTILSLRPHFLSSSEKLLSQEFKAWAQQRWAPLVRKYIGALLSPCAGTQHTRERMIFSCLEDDRVLLWRGWGRVFLRSLNSCGIELRPRPLDSDQVVQKWILALK